MQRRARPESDGIAFLRSKAVFDSLPQSGRSPPAAMGSIASTSRCERTPPAFGDALDAYVRLSPTYFGLRGFRLRSRAVENNCLCVPDAMQDDHTSAQSINKQEVRSEMTHRESAPFRTALAEPVLAEG